jgi:hypothetical protein
MPASKADLAPLLKTLDVVGQATNNGSGVAEL